MNSLFLSKECTPFICEQCGTHVSGCDSPHHDCPKCRTVRLLYQKCKCSYIQVSTEFTVSCSTCKKIRLLYPVNQLLLPKASDHYLKWLKFWDCTVCKNMDLPAY